jgi:hypothetical protein
MANAPLWDRMIRFYCCFYPAVKRQFGKSEICSLVGR